MPTSPGRRARRPVARRLGLLAGLLLLPACGTAAGEEAVAGPGDGVAGADATAAPEPVPGTAAPGTGAGPSTGTAAPTTPVPTVDDADVATDPVAGEEDPGEKDAEPGTGAGGSGEESATAADVVLTYAGWDGASGQVQAGGYVAGVVESGGTCTLTLRSGDEVVTGTAAAEPDATTTVCVVGVDGLGEGTWTAVLGYRSAASAGSSREREIEVP